MKPHQYIYDSPAWRWTRKAVLARDGFRCQVGHDGCTGTATAVDHIVSLNAGGAPFDLDNLRATCTACNTTRANKARAKAKKHDLSSLWA